MIFIHLLFMCGCLIGFVMFLLMEIFANQSDRPFWQGSLGFLVLFLLIYWNLRIELKNEDKIIQEKSTKCLQIKKR